MNMMQIGGADNKAVAEPGKSSTILIAETAHQRVFRLIRGKKFEAAARAAKLLIDAGDVDGFFIYGGGARFRLVVESFRKQVAAGAKAKMAAVEKITPELAQVMLAHNAGNRHVRASGLADRMRDIAEGRWEVTGQPIIISDDARVNDGQHRLFAILLLGATVESFVVYGTTRASALPIDTGEVRTSADRFALGGIPNYARVAAVVRVVNKILLERDPTETELLDLYYVDPENYQFSVRCTGGMPKTTSCSGLSAAAFLLIRDGARRIEVETFFAQVRLGHNLARHSATHTLREYILSRKLQISAAVWATTVYALFHEWRQGRRVREIKPVRTLPEKGSAE